MKKPPDLEGFQEFCNIQKDSKKKINKDGYFILNSLMIGKSSK